MITTVITLLVIYQIKHFVADYPLQGEYMLRKFSADPKIWIPSLTAHAGVHAFFTLMIGMAVTGYFALPVGLAILDFVTHFTMDRIKASPNMLGRFKPIAGPEYVNLKHMSQMTGDHPEIVLARENATKDLAEKLRKNNYFWWSLGFDQMVHHLTHYAIIYILVS